MIIDAVVFFTFVFIVLVIGGAIALADLSRRRKLAAHTTDNVDAVRQLSFPQRHWLLLCILVAIVSPLLANGIEAVVHKKNHDEHYQSVSQDRATDTSYHVATPPAH